MKYYITDTTLRPPQEKTFTTYSEVISYLEGMTIRESGRSRKQLMNELMELGYGFDDRNSVAFIRNMAERFSIGVIRDAGGVLRKTRCDITAIEQYQKDEFGD